MRSQQAAILELKLVHAKCAVDDQRQNSGLERFGEEIVSALRHGPQRICYVVLTGQHNDFRVRR